MIVKANDTGLEHTTISLEKLVDMSDGLTLTTMQEAIASKEATIRQVGISIIGVTLFLLLFSIITFASTIITNIATKKREYAMFQSIGMTRKQTEKMALCESCVLAIGSLILTLILGIILGQILIKGLISAGIFYLSYTFPLALFTVYCIVVVLIILMITISAFYSLQKNKDSRFPEDYSSTTINPAFSGNCMTSGSGAGSETSAVCSEPSAASRTICAFRAVAGMNPAGIVTAAGAVFTPAMYHVPALRRAMTASRPISLCGNTTVSSHTVGRRRMMSRAGR
ncbi:MAG: ABC transporter permease [Alistipes onderdonkii]|nr:ABC transporter permease [Alistipes onderdonkii]